MGKTPRTRAWARGRTAMRGELPAAGTGTRWITTGGWFRLLPRRAEQRQEEPIEADVAGVLPGPELRLRALSHEKDVWLQDWLTKGEHSMGGHACRTQRGQVTGQ